MTKEYTNDNVYEFLAEECRYDESLWETLSGQHGTKTR